MKGEVIAALIDLSKRRKYAKSLAAAVAGHLAAGRRGPASSAFAAYHLEIDNVLVDFTRVIRQLAKDLEAHRTRGHNNGRAPP